MARQTATSRGLRAGVNDVDTEYDCVHCGQALYFDTKALRFRHKAVHPSCLHPLAHAVSVVVGIVCPAVSPVTT